MPSRLMVIALAGVLLATPGLAAMKAGPGVLGRHHRLGGSGGVLIGNGVQAGLDFRFTTGGYYQQGQAAADTSLMTVVRASSKSCDDSAGNFTTVGNNVLCVTNKGALIEEARTNSIRNNSMQGAVVGTPGTLPTNWGEVHANGITPAVVGTGTESGIDYVDVQFLGTATAGNNQISIETATTIAAVNAQAWAQAVFLRVVGGDLTNINNVNLIVSQANAGGTGVGDLVKTLSPQPTAAGLGSQRFTNPITTNQATIAFVYPQLQLQNAAGSVNLTLRIGWPQLELGSFATSPIRTTNAAVTRQADVVTVTTPPSFGSAYTLFAQGTPIPPPTSIAVLLSADDGSTSNRSQLHRSSNPGVNGATGGSSYWNAGTVDVWAAGLSKKLAAAFAPSDQAAVWAGGTPITNATGTPFLGTQVHVGSRADGPQQWNGYLERIALWPTTRLPNATLQSLTQ